MTLEDTMDKRRNEFIEEHARKSKALGDFHHQQAVNLGAQDDYMEADHGEAPQGAQWN